MFVIGFSLMNGKCECSQINDEPKDLALQDIQFLSMHVFQVLDFCHMCCFESSNICKHELFNGILVGNMITSVVGCGAGTCGDNVDIISLFALGGDTRSTICEVGLSHPNCKGGPTILPTIPFVLGVGCPICCDNSILWVLIVCSWISISIP
jgi:hypothetical protein